MLALDMIFLKRKKPFTTFYKMAFPATGACFRISRSSHIIGIHECAQAATCLRASFIAKLPKRAVYRSSIMLTHLAISVIP